MLFTIHFTMPMAVLLFVSVLVIYYLLKDNIKRFSFGLFIYFLPIYLFTVKLIGVESHFNYILLLSYSILLILSWKGKKNSTSEYNILFYLSFLMLLFSTYFPFLRILFVEDTYTILSWGKLTILPATVMLAVAYLLFKIDISVEFLNIIAKFFFIFGILIIIDGNIGYNLGAWKKYSQHMSASQSLLSTFIAGGADNTVRLLTLSIISTYYLFRKNMIMFLIYLALSFPIFIFAGSRTGYVGLLIAILFMMKGIIKQPRFYLLVVVTLTTFFLFLYPHIVSITHGIRHENIYSLDSLQYRIQRWDALYQYSAEDPQALIFGSGFQRFGRSTRDKYYAETISPLILDYSTHNVFVDFVVDNGLLGGVFVLYYLGYSLLSIFKTNFGDAHSVYATSFSSIVIVMVMTSSWFHPFIFFIAFYLLVCAKKNTINPRNLNIKKQRVSPEYLV